jgi:hypothetical protein
MDDFIEKFDINPFRELEDIDYFKELYGPDTEIEDYIKEASSGLDSTNVFQRIIGTIVRIFKWIGKKIMQFVEWLKSVFGMDKKSADQILEEIKEKIGTIIPNLPVKGSKKIRIPANPASSVKPPDIIEVAGDAILIAFNKGKKSIKVSLIKSTELQEAQERARRQSFELQIGKNGLMNNKIIPREGVANQLIVGDYHWYDTITLILNDTVVNSLMKVVDFISKERNIDVRFEKILNKYYNEKNKLKPSSFDEMVAFNTIEVTLEQIQKFQMKITEINKKLEAVDDPNTKFIFTNNDKLKKFNNFAQEIFGFQMGINALTSTIAKSFQVSRRWLNTIKDIETLDTFIKKLIEGGIPSKFVANNCFLACDTNLKGTFKDDEKG